MKKIIYSILFILILIIIFLFSSQNGEQSLKLTINSIDNVVNKDVAVNKEESNNNEFNKVNTKQQNKEELIDKLIKPVRKSAHFIEFMILGIITILMLNSFKIKHKYLILISLLFCFIYACTDEIHQLFVVGRTSRFTDVLIDTSGSFTGIMITYILIKRRCNNENNI